MLVLHTPAFGCGGGGGGVFGCGGGAVSLVLRVKSIATADGAPIGTKGAKKS
jgi:hypothetical protein